jgi:hypothetical protein
MLVTLRSLDNCCGIKIWVSILISQIHRRDKSSYQYSALKVNSLSFREGYIKAEIIIYSIDETYIQGQQSWPYHHGDGSRINGDTIDGEYNVWCHLVKLCTC